MAETGKYRIHKLWIKGPKQGSSEVILDNLPGFPDGISRRSDGSGNFWVAIISPRKKFVDFVHPFPWLKWVGLKLRPILPLKPEKGGYVIEMTGDGEVVRTLQSTSVNGISAATEREGKLYLAHLQASQVDVKELV